ncbi:phosphoadenosine phosphosulfate reductase domain-containing protein [Microvirga alba]|uniref:Phosphoadenosine phosphosulfate reductase family protein n=1 Tax=Microvirga alba TaxID=2791025 RepID=A0A931FUF6_9HYPH|nr:phosphoadenosine phosphosulfate reductase family protein [Microvirga alba]MBF9235566.1 phosphoadenosine phosphosulfate reductase family protein [Microvirga alba]
MEHNVISISGGKDSTALLLLAIERQTENMQAVFADTGHEHPQTYEYVRYLEQATGVPIRWVRADFTADIERKREFVRTKWPAMLIAGKPEKPGYWLAQVGAPANDNVPKPTHTPVDPYSATTYATWDWMPAVRGIAPKSEEEAAAVVERALAVLQPTGNPFLDLCLWKGRFPSTRARFCSEELKRNPIIEQVQLPLLDAGDDVISWQGVRADESASRANLTERECKGTWESGAELWNYRPILKWTAQDCFDMHRKHGIKPNPLYQQGMGRVGCMPCIHARKDELLEISKRFPEEIARVAEWERIVSDVSKRNSATFFAASDLGVVDNDETVLGRANIMKFVEWSKTSRGGRQMDFLRADNDNLPLCTSIYGLCE